MVTNPSFLSTENSMKRKTKREKERERGKKKKNSLFIFPRAPPVFTSGSKTDTDPHEENSKH